MPEVLTVGWREWLALPELGVDKIKAKVDTGARTSALHTFYIEPFTKGSEHWVKFGVHPIQGDLDTVVHCTAPIKDQRTVRDSGGHAEDRYVIDTLVNLGGKIFTAELTLTNRENMRFRMLLGRTALRGRALVSPGRTLGSYSRGKPASGRSRRTDRLGKLCEPAGNAGSGL